MRKLFASVVLLSVYSLAATAAQAASGGDPFSEATTKVEEANEMLIASGFVAAIGFAAILVAAVGLIFNKTKPEFAYRILGAGILFAAAGSLSAWIFGG